MRVLILRRWIPWCSILIAISHINGVLCDLPIHATINDMKGDWVFHLSLPSSGDINACGSGIPNRNTDNLEPEFQDYLGFLDRTQGIKTKVSVTLSDRSIPFSTVRDLGSNDHRGSWKALAVLDTESQNIIGGWSAVYDEGFEVYLGGGMRLMGLMKYSRQGSGCLEPKDGDLEDSSGHTHCYVTDPGKTQIGWYTTMNSGRPVESGCFYGEKQGVQNPSTSSFVYTYSGTRGGDLSVSEAAISYYTSDSFVNKHNSRVGSTWKAAANTPFLIQNKSILGSFLNESAYKKVNVTGGYSAVPSFLQNSDAITKPVHYQEQVYACPCKEGETLVDTRTGEEATGDAVLSAVSLIESVSKNAFIREHYSGSVENELPREFAWPNPISHPALPDTTVNQGECGSCYALATAYALQERFRIRSAEKLGVDLRTFDRRHVASDAVSQLELINSIQLSAQSIISCSFYNQGCHGGFPYLVGKDAVESGILCEDCLPYVGNDVGNCPTRQSSGSAKPSLVQSAQEQVTASKVCHSEDNRWYAGDYGYVGGCYECTQCAGEELIMAEVYHNGPVVAAMDAPASLLTYQDGVYQTDAPQHARYCDSPPSDSRKTVLTGWEYTNHAVTIVGWGETVATEGKRAQKYWIIRNTWGPEWGKQGYFLLARGVNAGGIESQVTFIDPDFTRGAGLALANKIKVLNERAAHSSNL